MPFPLILGEQTFPDGPSLAAAVVADARAGGGTVVKGKPPSRWLGDLVESGDLEVALAGGLVAALLQKQEDAAAVTEAARLSKRLGLPALGEILLLSLEAMDAGLLLTADPLGRHTSVEDALLEAACEVVDLSDEGLRQRLLTYLRNAGLNEQEARIVAEHGSPSEIRMWLPAILLERPSQTTADALVEGLLRGGKITDALVDVLTEAPGGTPPVLRATIEHSPKRKALQRIVPRLYPQAEAGEA